MRLIGSDPDLATIVNRIRDNSLDLQPEFQRGVVWSTSKQQLLIDSILRDWYIPPIHVVHVGEGNQVVLDGQQRLRSIYEFVEGNLSVNGNADPSSEQVRALNGLHYEGLPDAVRRRFDRFTLRVFEVIDYEPEEPYELFYRLNQPATLTSAEKRNAFFGPPRDQIGELTAIAERSGMIPARIGFSNARFAYEDIIARFVWTLEAGTLSERVTAQRLTNRYRTGEPFSGEVLDWAASSIKLLFSVGTLDQGYVRLNRATAYSWLCFVARAVHGGEALRGLDIFLADTETARNSARRGRPTETFESPVDGRGLLYAVLNDRATARVTDAASVILRDAILWILYSKFRPGDVSSPALRDLVDAADKAEPYELEDALMSAAVRNGWDRLR